MEDYFRKLAKEQGFSDEDIAGFLQTVPKPDQTMQEAAPREFTARQLVGEERKPIVPDYVSPMIGDKVSMTGTFGDGHYGEDLVYTDGSKELRNPIGGLPFTGTINGGFGNYAGVIGYSPEELAQMTPEEKARQIEAANAYMAGNPLNIAGLKDIVPNRNVSLQGHLEEPVYYGQDGIATGAARMKLGSTGHSTGPHLHQEFMDVEGNIVPFSQLLEKEIQKRMK